MEANNRRSIASKAASLVTKLNNSGKKFYRISSTSGPVSPYFNKEFKPLSDIGNFSMVDRQKIPFTFKIPPMEVISSEDVYCNNLNSLHQSSSPERMCDDDDDFFDNLLRNMTPEHAK